MTINTNSETKAYLVNRDFLINRLDLQSKNEKSILFEKSDLLVLSPSIQNNRYSFDLQKNTVEVARNSNKKGLLIIRFFQDYLVLSLKKVFSDLLVGETIHTYEDGRQKWSMNVRKKEEDYYVSIYGDTRELKTTKYTGVELELYVNRLLEEVDEEEFHGEEFHEEVELQQISSSDLIPHIHNYITSQGFNYTPANIKNLYLSLRSKPFVIISGISGTGKTKIVQLFAESIGATEDNGQFTLIPVRPDWSDGSELLGYTDIKGDFIEGPLTKVVREASDNLERPYFVLLDEMNLARVEYYFSDVLSIMESRKKVGDTYTSSTLITIDEEKLSLPGNVYIIGTVNMDETTHPFSKKVLDRANTIEFNEIYLDSFAFLENPPQIEPVHLANSSIEASYVQIQDCFAGNEQIVKDVSTKLANINAIIEPLNAHVGYRVRDEICFYMIHNSDGPLFDEQNALDYCIMQKILPRLAGSGLKIRQVLEQLFDHFTGDKYESDMDFEKSAALYPLSAKKVYDMLGRLGDEGFTSFWIS